MTTVPRALPRKQNSRHEDWLSVFEGIKAAPDRARAEYLVGEAAERVRDRVRGVRRVAYGWSGGKDSQGLRVVMEAAGIEESVLVISGLEFPAFLAWATDHMPWGLSVNLRRNLDIEWLARNPRMLFPADSTSASRWFSSVQHAGQREYARERGLDLMILGRRRADGNTVGRGKAPATGAEYMDPHGFVRYSPIADWTHEDLLHVIAAYEMPLPPCYGWPRGFRVGTGPWPARQWTASVSDGWREVAEIDLDVLRLAARHDLPGAREALCAA